MKRIKKWLCIWLVCVMVAAWLPTTARAETVEVQSFSFDAHNKTGFLGEKVSGRCYLYYSFEPYGATEAVTQMVSSDPSVFSVEYDGYDRWITKCHKVGTAVVTATTASGLTDTCTVTVKEMEAVVINEPFTATVQPNDTVLFTYTTEDADWYSFYSENGEGNLNIYYVGKPYYGTGVDTQSLPANEPLVLAVWNDSNEVKTFDLCIRKAVPAERIEFLQDSYEVYPYEEIGVVADVYPIWAIPEYDITYSSSDESVAYFESSGRRILTPIKAGTTTVTVTAGSGISDQCQVTVKPFETIKLDEPQTVTLQPDDRLKYAFTPEEDGEYLFYRSKEDITFQVYREDGWLYSELIGVQENLLCDNQYFEADSYPRSSQYDVNCYQLTAGKQYVIVLFNTSEGNQYSEEVPVTATIGLVRHEIPEEVVIKTVDPNERMLEGDPVNFLCESVSGMPAGGNITWSSSNEAVLKPGSSYGNTVYFLAVGTGTAVITATLENGASASYEATVGAHTDYSVISGYNSYIVKGSGKELCFTIDCPKDTPVVEVQICCEAIYTLPKNSYKFTEGNTVITIDPAYLDLLDYGGYEIGIYYATGSAYGYFSVIKEEQENDCQIVGHKWEEIGCASPLTCSVCGATLGGAIGHKWVDATCDTPKTCSVCKATEGSAKGHSYADGKCTVCGTADPNYKEPEKPTEPAPTEPTTPNEPTTPQDPTPVGPSGTDRLAGATRYATAFTAADELKKLQGVEKFDTIIVSSGEQFADALAGSYLAAAKNAPILLVKDSTVKSVKEYIQANLNPGGTVYLLGGKVAVPEKMETGLEGFTVKRLGGNTRYDTNLLILQEAGVAGKDIVVCTGKDFADSLSASAVGLPILLVKDSLNAAQKEFLTGNTGKIYVIGGENAVSKKAESQLATYGTVERLAGATRYKTSVLVAETFFGSPTSAVIAYGENFPDGLSGGPVAYALKAPLILTREGREKDAAGYITAKGITSGYVQGGTTVLPEKTVNKVFGK